MPVSVEPTGVTVDVPLELSVDEVPGSTLSESPSGLLNTTRSVEFTGRMATASVPVPARLDTAKV